MAKKKKKKRRGAYDIGLQQADPIKLISFSLNFLLFLS